MVRKARDFFTLFPHSIEFDKDMKTIKVVDTSLFSLNVNKQEKFINIQKLDQVNFVGDGSTVC